MENKSFEEKQLLGRFSSTMKELLFIDPTANVIFDSLLAGSSPYILLEQLIINQRRLSELLIDAESKKPRQYVIQGNVEIIDELKRKFK